MTLMLNFQTIKHYFIAHLIVKLNSSIAKKPYQVFFKFVINVHASFQKAEVYLNFKRYKT